MCIKQLDNFILRLINLGWVENKIFFKPDKYQNATSNTIKGQ